MKFEKTEINLGKVKKGTTKKFKFPFEGQVQNLYKSCNCTSAIVQDSEVVGKIKIKGGKHSPHVIAKENPNDKTGVKLTIKYIGE